MALEHELLEMRHYAHQQVADVMTRAAIWIIAAKRGLPKDEEKPRQQTNQPTLAEMTQEYEREQLQDVLTETGNNRTEAARRLGISRTAIYKKLRKHHFYGLSPKG